LSFVTTRMQCFMPIRPLLHRSWNSFGCTGWHAGTSPASLIRAHLQPFFYGTRTRPKSNRSGTNSNRSLAFEPLAPNEVTSWFSSWWAANDFTNRVAELRVWRFLGS
jgi:hypothetical protein